MKVCGNQEKSQEIITNQSVSIEIHAICENDNKSYKPIKSMKINGNQTEKSNI